MGVHGVSGSVISYKQTCIQQSFASGMQLIFSNGPTRMAVLALVQLSSVVHSSSSSR
jgi:hypothetical protein